MRQRVYKSILKCCTVGWECATNILLQVIAGRSSSHHKRRLRDLLILAGDHIAAPLGCTRILQDKVHTIDSMYPVDVLPQRGESSCRMLSNHDDSRVPCCACVDGTDASQTQFLLHCTLIMASWTCSVCRIGMLGRLHPLARCPPAWPLRSRWPAASSKASAVRCSSSETDRLPPPDVRKLAQLAQIAVTDEQVRCPTPPLSHAPVRALSPSPQGKHLNKLALIHSQPAHGLRTNKLALHRYDVCGRF